MRTLAFLCVLMLATPAFAGDVPYLYHFTAVPAAAGYKLYARQFPTPWPTPFDVGLPLPAADGTLLATELIPAAPPASVMDFAVTAYDSGFRESPLSNICSVVVATYTPTPTATVTPSASPSATRTATATGTSTPTVTRTSTPTATAANTATGTATHSPVPTATAANTPTPTRLPAPTLLSCDLNSDGHVSRIEALICWWRRRG